MDHCLRLRALQLKLPLTSAREAYPEKSHSIFSPLLIQNLRKLLIPVCSALAVCARIVVASADTISLDLPIACEMGRTCFIQNYVDRDPTNVARDYRCGMLTYDGHKGTDFRITDLKAQRAGVDVRAAAAGIVLRLRDGTPDLSAAEIGRPAVKGRECGNGLIISHPDGWETQYCHLARGSIVVQQGETVRAGQVLGRVGLSGATEFPHLHFGVRHQGRIIDPFNSSSSTACEAGSGLWKSDLREALDYHPRQILNYGFGDSPVTMAAIEAGDQLHAPQGDSVALVAYVRVIGARIGDVARLIVTAPDGEVLVDHTAAALDRDKAQVLNYAGKKRPKSGWLHGRYEASYTVRAGGKIVLSHEFSFTL
jgi:hypothetical protein